MERGDEQLNAGGHAPHRREPSSAEPRPPEPAEPAEPAERAERAEPAQSPERTEPTAPAGRQRRGRRALALASAALAVVLVAGALAAYAEYRSLFSSIDRVRVTGLGHRPPRYNGALNILVIGSDSRKGPDARFGAHIDGQRSDTVMVLHLSPGRTRAIVMSVPRDSVVPVLACPPASGAPGQTAAPGQVEQINATFAQGGPGCLWKSVEQTTHIRLDHFMELTFSGFERIINDIGGVNICLPYAINDPHSRLHLSRGRHHVMGARALAFWRVRYIGIGSDLERIQRDQYLMASVAQDVKHSNVLSDPGRVYSVVTDIAASLTTDSQLGQGTLISIAQSLRNLPLRAVQFIQVPVLPYPQNPNWVQWAPQASKLFSAIAHDRKLPRLRSRHRPAVHASSSPGTAPQVAAGRTTPSSAFLPNLTKTFDGITARTNACRDARAFAGPLGGH
jgi:LCP family protein required for cell wall assembly